MSRKRIGLMLSLYRKRTKQSVRDLEVETGLSRSTISRIENGDGGMDALAVAKIITWMMGENKK